MQTTNFMMNALEFILTSYKLHHQHQTAIIYKHQQKKKRKQSLLCTESCHAFHCRLNANFDLSQPFKQYAILNWNQYFRIEIRLK